jgi:hypothetical protein
MQKIYINEGKRICRKNKRERNNRCSAGHVGDRQGRPASGSAHGPAMEREVTSC